VLEIGLLSLEGGGALNPLSLPLSTFHWRQQALPSSFSAGIENSPLLGFVVALRPAPVPQFHVEQRSCMASSLLPMNRAILTLIGLLLVIGGSFFVWESSRTTDPVVRGQRLSRWLIVLSTDREGTAPYTAAVEAIREAGTNGLPLMLRMLQTEDFSISRAVARALRNQHKVHAKWTMEWDFRLAALRGLKLLGPAAESAAPRLGELMCMTNFTSEATLALLQMGRPALTEFRRALTNQEPMVRSWAAIGIRQLHNEQAFEWGTKPSDAAWDKELIRPLLLLSTDSQTPGAPGALAAIIRTDPDTAIPEISKGLADPNRNVCDEAVRVLPVAIQFQSPTTR
jgi:hypothetical protein